MPVHGPDADQPSNPPTMGDVAERAGVSRATVSRALSQPHRLRPETVERVKQVAGELGYVLNPVAKALSTGRFGNLALVVPDIANPFFPPMIRAVEGLADQAGFSVFLGNGDEDPAREAKLLGQLATRVDGIVLASSRMADAEIREFAAQRPLVLINRDVAGLPRVLIDSAGGVARAVEHLAGLGHRRVAYLNGPTRSWSNAQRRRTVQRSAERAGLTVAMIPARRSGFEQGRQAVPALLDSGATAAIAFDDLLAHGVLTGLAEHGVAVPSEFSVIGCDDVLATQTHPRLTTVSARAAEAGAAAVELLTGRLTGPVAVSDARIMLETSLVVRASTAEVAAGRS